MFELDAGDLSQAYKKLWGASTQVLKSLAELRHRFAFESELHTNLYENWLDESEIRESAVHVRDFVETLAGI